MRRRRLVLAALVCVSGMSLASREGALGAQGATALKVAVTIGPSLGGQAVDGRLLLMISTDPSAEPRLQIGNNPTDQQIFGIDVDGLKPGQEAWFDASVLGYPKRIWDKRTGVIDAEVARHWRDNYDLSHILRRDWDKGLGKKLEGKINVYVGDMDNYYLNNAVYLLEDFLRTTKAPAYGGEVKYGDRAEHCWNGDPTRANGYSRLRYHQMFIPRIADRILATAPAGADVKSWR